MAKVTFNSIFEKDSEGFLNLKQKIRIGGVTISPGIRFKHSSFAGIDFSDPQFFGHDLEIKTDGDVTIITGIY